MPPYRLAVAAALALVLVTSAAFTAVASENAAHVLNQAQAREGITPLPSTMLVGNLNPYTFTISGISSGACMAVQFQYAWSTIVKGAAIIAAAPYLCAGGTVAGAEACLNTPEIEAPPVFYASAEYNAAANLIDPLENLKNQTIFLFSGTADTIVPQPNMDYVALMYTFAGAGDRMTKYFNYSAEHAWVTNKYGNDCGYLGDPYINNCGIDFGGQFLKQAFADLNVPFNDQIGVLNTSNFFSFDQTQFGADPNMNSMGREAYAYIPLACQSGKLQCHLHVNLHGCQQDFLTLGTQYLYQTELNEWAEANNIVILYPQAIANLLNPMGCFDWWGYASETYAIKTGPQISLIRSMIQYFGGF
jgi:poly(3-hydroxybutyrate) depolymerase